MAFEYEVTDRTVFGNKRVVFGWFESDDSSNGGDIDTGLDRVLFVSLTPYADGGVTAVIDSDSYDDFPEDVSNPVVSIQTSDDCAGLFMAVGL